MKHTMKMMQSCSLCVQMTPGLMIEISYIINDLLWWLNCLPCLITELEGCYLVTPVFVYSVGIHGGLAASYEIYKYKATDTSYLN